MFLPIQAENQPGLIADLEGDPFVGHALSSATCELYHRYGMFLALLTAALTTIKHCQFGHRCPAVINDGNQEDGGEPRGSSGGRPAETPSPAEPAHVERVTEKKAKVPQKVAAGRAGAGARQKRLLEQLQAAKESLRPPVSAADNDGTSAPPKEAKPPKGTDEQPEHNWIP